MVKRIVLSFLMATALCLVAFFLHLTFIEKSALHYSLKSVYIFNLTASFIIYLLVELLHAKGSSQAGLFYLVLIPIKLFLFFLFFKEDLFTEDGMNPTERIGLVVPMLLFLLFEIISTASILNKDS